jgi:HK97 family phage portal protein
VSLRDWLHRVTAPQNSAPSVLVTRNASSWGDLFAAQSGVPTPTESSALTSSAIYASVNLIAGAIAALPALIYDRSREGEMAVRPSDPLWWMLNEQMMPRWSAANGWEFLCQSLLLHGNAYAEILRNRAGEVTGLWPIHPGRVVVVATPDGQRLVYSVDPDPLLTLQGQTRRTLDQDDMIHVAGFGFDGVKGLSMLRHALSMAGGSSLAMQEFAGRFFVNSARPDYLLTSDNAIGKEKVEEIYARLEDRHGGAGKAHRPMVLGNGLKFQAITMPLSDMQLLDQRRFQIEEVARIYGVPAFMIGHTEKTTSWGSGVEQMGTGFVRYALRQHLNKFENEINRKLFRTASRVMRFDTTELERADTKSLMESLRIGIGRAGERPIISVNEARAVLNRNKAAGGDSMEPAAAQPSQASQGQSDAQAV